MLNSIARVKQLIAENWEKTIRFPNQQSEAEVPLPYPSILWSGLPSVAQAEKMVHNLPLLEYNSGIVACQPGPRPPGQHYQWDYPNAWAPSQFATIAGLLHYGYTLEARRLAEKYVACVANSFDKTGNLWEKYNGVNGSVDVIDEYKMPAMLGWTAGTFLYTCEVLES